MIPLCPFFKMNARESLPFTVERAVLIDSAGILPKKSLRQKMSLRCYKIGRTSPASAISSSIRLASSIGVAVSRSPQIRSVGHFTR